jgi:hypothetical protein
MANKVIQTLGIPWQPSFDLGCPYNAAGDSGSADNIPVYTLRCYFSHKQHLLDKSSVTNISCEFLLHILFVHDWLITADFIFQSDFSTWNDMMKC